MRTTKKKQREAKQKISQTLLEAVICNDIKAAETLIISGANVNARDQSGCPVLYHACALGHVEMVKVLIAAGADPNETYRMRDFKTSSPLRIAVECNQVEVVRFLLTLGMNRNTSSSAITYAASNGNFAMLKLLAQLPDFSFASLFMYGTQSMNKNICLMALSMDISRPTRSITVEQNPIITYIYPKIRSTYIYSPDKRFVSTEDLDISRRGYPSEMTYPPTSGDSDEILRPLPQPYPDANSCFKLWLATYNNPRSNLHRAVSVCAAFITHNHPKPLEALSDYYSVTETCKSPLTALTNVPKDLNKFIYSFLFTDEFMKSDFTRLMIDAASLARKKSKCESLCHIL
jgi:hypothetical protein